MAFFAYSFKSWPKKKGTTCVNLNTWMTDLPEVVKCRPITQLAIPGTFNSFTYTLHSKSFLAPDFNENTTKVTQFKKKFKWALRNWCKLQFCDVTSQLSIGIRFFDINVCVLMNNHEKIYVCNGLVAGFLQPFLEEIKSFLEKHSHEIVIISVGMFYNMNDSSHNVLLNLLCDTFSSMIHVTNTDDDIHTLTVKGMQNSGHQVVIIYAHSRGHSKGFYTDRSIYRPAFREKDVDNLLEKLNKANDSRNTQKLFIAEFALALDIQYIMLHPRNSYKTTVSKLLNFCASNWLFKNMSSESGVNVVLFTHVSAKPDCLSHLVVGLNYFVEKLPARFKIIQNMPETKQSTTPVDEKPKAQFNEFPHLDLSSSLSSIIVAEQDSLKSIRSIVTDLSKSSFLLNNVLAVINTKDPNSSSESLEVLIKAPSEIDSVKSSYSSFLNQNNGFPPYLIEKKSFERNTLNNQVFENQNACVHLVPPLTSVTMPQTLNYEKCSTSKSNILHSEKSLIKISPKSPIECIKKAKSLLSAGFKSIFSLNINDIEVSHDAGKQNNQMPSELMPNFPKSEKSIEYLNNKEYISDNQKSLCPIESNSEKCLSTKNTIDTSGILINTKGKRVSESSSRKLKSHVSFEEQESVTINEKIQNDLNQTEENTISQERTPSNFKLDKHKFFAYRTSPKNQSSSESTISCKLVERLKLEKSVGEMKKIVRKINNIRRLDTESKKSTDQVFSDSKLCFEKDSVKSSEKLRDQEVLPKNQSFSLLHKEKATSENISKKPKSFNALSQLIKPKMVKYCDDFDSSSKCQKSVIEDLSDLKKKSNLAATQQKLKCNTIHPENSKNSTKPIDESILYGLNELIKDVKSKVIRKSVVLKPKKFINANSSNGKLITQKSDVLHDVNNRKLLDNIHNKSEAQALISKGTSSIGFVRKQGFGSFYQNETSQKHLKQHGGLFSKPTNNAHIYKSTTQNRVVNRGKSKTTNELKSLKKFISSGPNYLADLNQANLLPAAFESHHEPDAIQLNSKKDCLPDYPGTGSMPFVYKYSRDTSRNSKKRNSSYQLQQSMSMPVLQSSNSNLNMYTGDEIRQSESSSSVSEKEMSVEQSNLSCLKAKQNSYETESIFLKPLIRESSSVFSGMSNVHKLLPETIGNVQPQNARTIYPEVNDKKDFKNASRTYTQGRGLTTTRCDNFQNILNEVRSPWSDVEETMVSCMGMESIISDMDESSGESKFACQESPLDEPTLMIQGIIAMQGVASRLSILFENTDFKSDQFQFKNGNKHPLQPIWEFQNYGSPKVLPNVSVKENDSYKPQKKYNSRISTKPNILKNKMTCTKNDLLKDSQNLVFTDEENKTLQGLSDNLVPVLVAGLEAISTQSNESSAKLYRKCLKNVSKQMTALLFQGLEIFSKGDVTVLDDYINQKSKDVQEQVPLEQTEKYLKSIEPTQSVEDPNFFEREKETTLMPLQKQKSIQSAAPEKKSSQNDKRCVLENKTVPSNVNAKSKSKTCSPKKQSKIDSLENIRKRVASVIAGLDVFDKENISSSRSSLKDEEGSLSEAAKSITKSIREKLAALVIDCDISEREAKQPQETEVKKKEEISALELAKKRFENEVLTATADSKFFKTLVVSSHRNLSRALSLGPGKHLEVDSLEFISKQLVSFIDGLDFIENIYIPLLSRATKVSQKKSENNSLVSVNNRLDLLIKRFRALQKEASLDHGSYSVPVLPKGTSKQNDKKLIFSSIKPRNKYDKRIKKKCLSSSKIDIDPDANSFQLKCEELENPKSMDNLEKPEIISANNVPSVTKEITSSDFEENQAFSVPSALNLITDQSCTRTICTVNNYPIRLTDKGNNISNPPPQKEITVKLFEKQHWMCSENNSTSEAKPVDESIVSDEQKETNTKRKDLALELRSNCIHLTSDDQFEYEKQRHNRSHKKHNVPKFDDPLQMETKKVENGSFFSMQKLLDNPESANYVSKCLVKSVPLGSPLKTILENPSKNRVLRLNSKMMLDLSNYQRKFGLEDAMGNVSEECLKSSSKIGSCTYRLYLADKSISVEQEEQKNPQGENAATSPTFRLDSAHKALSVRRNHSKTQIVQEIYPKLTYEAILSQEIRKHNIRNKNFEREKNEFLKNLYFSHPYSLDSRKLGKIERNTGKNIGIYTSCRQPLLVDKTTQVGPKCKSEYKGTVENISLLANLPTVNQPKNGTFESYVNSQISKSSVKKNKRHSDTQTDEIENVNSRYKSTDKNATFFSKHMSNKADQVEIGKLKNVPTFFCNLDNHSNIAQCSRLADSSFQYLSNEVDKVRPQGYKRSSFHESLSHYIKETLESMRKGRSDSEDRGAHVRNTAHISSIWTVVNGQKKDNFDRVGSGRHKNVMGWSSKSSTDNSTTWANETASAAQLKKSIMNQRSIASCSSGVRPQTLYFEKRDKQRKHSTSVPTVKVILPDHKQENDSESRNTPNSSGSRFPANMTITVRQNMENFKENSEAESVSFANRMVASGPKETVGSDSKSSAGNNTHTPVPVANKVVLTDSAKRKRSNKISPDVHTSSNWTSEANASVSKKKNCYVSKSLGVYPCQTDLATKILTVLSKNNGKSTIKRSIKISKLLVPDTNKLSLGKRHKKR